MPIMHYSLDTLPPAGVINNLSGLEMVFISPIKKQNPIVWIAK
jgi:hypothetical protein